MSIPINVVTMGCALFPVFLFLLLLIFWWGSAEAAPMAAFLSVLLAFAVFKASAMLIAVEGSKGVWNGLLIMLVLWSAALLYRILRQFAAGGTGAAGVGQDTGGKAASGSGNTGTAKTARGGKADSGRHASADTYHRSDIWKRIAAEKEDDRQPVALREGAIAYAVMLVMTLLAVVWNRSGGVALFSGIGFDFPESGTGYGFVNEAVQNYAPLRPFLHAAAVLLLADAAGLIVLGVQGRLGHGALPRILRKSFETALPGGIAVCALMLVLAVMNGTGEVYALSSGAVSSVEVMPVGILMLIAAPLMYYRSELRRVKKFEEEEARMQAALNAGEIRAVKQARAGRQPKFYETRNGGLSIAFLVIVVAFIFMMIGIWGSDETFTLDGFAAIITAMLYCPMRTFIFDKAAGLL